LKILFAVQGTGDIIPYLKTYGDLDILISGTQADVHLPETITYQKHGLSFIFGKRGGIDYWQTIVQSKPLELYKEIKNFPLEKYDLIINDFEPITAWAARLKKVETISLSHQCAFLSNKVPRPNFSDPIAKLVLEKYARCTHNIGFHFKEYDDYIHTPVIRKEIRDLPVSTNNHYTVYLPAYADDVLIEVLSKVKSTEWQVFSKHTKQAYSRENVHLQPVNNEAFNLSLASGTGLLTGGGFESPAEALFLGKKVLSIPMKGQYEQQCNAEALREMGIPVIKNFNLKQVKTIQDWVESHAPIKVDYPYHTPQIVQKMMQEYGTK
jgi:uncharacterized protein (TIGR00661 family)